MQLLEYPNFSETKLRKLYPLRADAAQLSKFSFILDHNENRISAPSL